MAAIVVFPAKAEAAEARALIQSKHEAALSARLAGTIRKIHFERGGKFTKGQTLATFDCAVQDAQLRKAQAELWSAEQTFKSRKSLQGYNAVSDVDLALAEGNARKAQAEVSIASSVVQDCVIKAPFDGRVVDIPAKENEWLGVGQPLIKILDDQALKAVVLVPAVWIAKLKPGMKLAIAVDGIGAKFSAKIVGLGASVDPSSQMSEIYADVEAPHAGLLPGMTGTAILGND
jgi:membrane fusion protein (multidrug efflux system)